MGQKLLKWLDAWRDQRMIGERAQVDGKEMEEVDKFKYLGIMTGADGEWEVGRNCGRYG